MKMRKILSFVLVLSLVLGSFSMAFAATPGAGLSDIAGSANKDAIQVAYDLGIVKGNPDGTYLPEKAVNRAEFAALITRALAIPESALAGYTATTFKDTAGYGWAVPYLAFAQSKGIMIGDGQGNVMPGRTITVNEAMTMVLRAVGYTNNSSALVGTWPANYVTLAQTKELYEDVAAATTVDKANAAQIIYNALTIDTVTVNADGKTEVTGKSLLTAGLGCTKEAEKVIKGDEKSAINLTQYLGAKVIPYTKSDKIVAIGEVKSTFITGKLNATWTKFTRSSDDKEFNVSAALAISTTPTGVKLVNGIGSMDSTTTIGALATDTSITLAVKLDGNDIKEFYSYATWTSPSRAMAKDNTVNIINVDKTLLGNKFKLDDDDNIDYSNFLLQGVASLKDIKKDNVVYVYTGTNSDGTFIKKVTVGTKTITGKVTSIDSDGVYTIGGEKVEVTSSPVGTPGIGDTGTAYLNYSGDVYKWDKESGAKGNYAVVTKPVGTVNVYDATQGVKLFKKDGSESIVNIKSGVTPAASVTPYALTTFELNSDGNITTISAVGATATSKLTKQLTFNGKLVDENAVVFVQTLSNEFSLGKVSEIVKDETITLTYAVNDAGKIDAIVVASADAGGASTFGFIASVYDGLNAKGDPAAMITAVVDGKVVTYTADKSDKTSYAAALDKLVYFNFDGEYVSTVTTQSATTTIGSPYAADTVGSYAANFGRVTVTAIDANRIQVNAGTPEYVLIDADAIVLKATFKSSGAFDKYVASTVESINENYHVILIQLDKDSSDYDLVIFVPTADIAKTLPALN